MIEPRIVRPIEPGEYDIVAKLCVEAYVHAGVVTAHHPYTEVLRDTKSRAEDPAAEMLVLAQGSDILGTVTMAPYGSPLTTICRPGEVEPRVLAVSPQHPREGIGSELVAASERWTIDHGLTTVVVCVADYNKPAFAMYERLGFTHATERNWVEPGGVLLKTMTKPVAGMPQLFCPRCGEPVASGSHQDCEFAMNLEPPRYCPRCKRRMIVQVTPGGWIARCKEHGIQKS